MKNANLKVINFSFFSVLGIVLSTSSTLISLYVPIIIGKIIDTKDLLTNPKSLYSMIGKTGLLLFLTTILSTIGGFIISREGDKFIKIMRKKINSHLLRLPISFFDENISGELASRVVNDVTIIKLFTTNIIPQNLTGMITLLGTSIVLFIMDWKLTLIILFSFPLYALITIPVGKITEKLSIKLQYQLSKLLSTVSESFRFIRTVKLNTAEFQVEKDANESIDNMYTVSVKGDALNSFVAPLQTLTSFCIIVAIIIYGALRVSDGSLKLANLVTMIMYLIQLIQPINTISSFYTNYKQCVGSLKEINKIMSINTEKYLKNENDNLKEVNNIKFRNVNFSYNSSSEIIFKSLNIEFLKNKKTAIVGPSGAGKTTIINLMTKLYSPTEGEILINDSKSSEDYSVEQWRSQFGVVSQENTVLSGTILNNLLFGLKKIPSEVEIKDALKSASLWDYVQNLPLKLNTLVGEQGFKLSGGQRQRLQIARTYLRNPKILILDEATSSLDPDSEEMITNSLKKLMKNKVTIVIAHRLSTVMDADDIYFIDQKNVLDHGDHEHLYNSLTEYKNFVDIQFGEPVQI